MAKVVALSTILHDGKEYLQGAEFDVKDRAQVEALKEAKAVIVKGEEQTEPQGGAK